MVILSLTILLLLLVDLADEFVLPLCNIDSPLGPCLLGLEFENPGLYSVHHMLFIL